VRVERVGWGERRGSRSGVCVGAGEEQIGRKPLGSVLKEPPAGAPGSSGRRGGSGRLVGEA